MLQQNKNTELHERNREYFNEHTSQELNSLITNQYSDIRFDINLQYLKRKFYKTTGVGKTPNIMMRQRETGDADLRISGVLVGQHLKAVLGESLDPTLNAFAIHLIPYVADTKYMPYSRNELVEENSTLFSNSYQPPDFNQTGEVKTTPPLWQEYLDRLMPKVHQCVQDNWSRPQQEYFDQYIAHLIQQPHIPPIMAILLRGEQGTGKGFWLDNIMSVLLGRHNYLATDIKDIKGNFLAPLYNTKLIQIEEVTSLRERATTAQTLKKLITQTESFVDEKYKDKKKVKKFFGVVITSNYDNPVPLEATDRRYFVPVFSKHQKNKSDTEKFFAKLSQWLEKEDGFQVLYNYFSSMEVHYNFTKAPPMTSDKEALLIPENTYESKRDMATIEIGRVDKDKYVFGLTDVQDHFKLSASDAKQALQNNGYRTVQRRWTKGQSVRLWVHQKHILKGKYDNLIIWKKRDEDRIPLYNG